ncbi:sensor histidine kinase [Noviherbaspirillum malthae]|uniref:sensor histidine kinase n=1 Tax=Noviherbaspirillum malthae TaxID=1260987 RepID=UPI00188EF263|nr:sensor histidine kinase [Noviherbaspirillum malthae]
MNRSIRAGLLMWLIGPLMVINFVGAVAMYKLAWGPAEDTLDHNLAEIAYDLRAMLRDSSEGVDVDLPLAVERVLRTRQEENIFFVVRDGTHVIAGDSDFPSLLLPGSERHPHAYSGRLRREDVRIVAMEVPLESRTIQIGVAETKHERHALQSRLLSTQLALACAVLIASALAIWFAVRKELLPLRTMQAELDARRPRELDLVSEKVPRELASLARAINGLLLRVEEDGKARHSFLANVAHQLRTPLAGLKAQLSLLRDKQEGNNDTVPIVDLVLNTTERMIRQTNQLLALARAEPTLRAAKQMHPLQLDALISEAVRDFVWAADQKHIDIGFELEPCRVMGDAFLLRDMIDNIVDNAVRYTPSGGSVTVRCGMSGDRAQLTVEDSGPGIPVTERDNIFSRFYRLDTATPGSGLGLAIVRDIATTHNAMVRVTDARHSTGALFLIQFPPVDMWNPMQSQLPLTPSAG